MESSEDSRWALEPVIIDVTVIIHPEGIHRVFPAIEALHFIKKQIHPLSGNDPFADIPIQIFRGHHREPHGFKIHFYDLLVPDAAAAQMLHHQLHQAGFSAAADTGNDLDHFRALKRLKLPQIDVTVFQALLHRCYRRSPLS